MDVQTFKSMLLKKHDETWLRYSRIFEKIQMTCDLSSMNKEVASLHSMKKSRHLATKSNISVDNLIKAYLDDMAYRSRLIEIAVVLSKKHRTLELILDATSSYLSYKYGTYLTDKVSRLKSERQAYIDEALSDGHILLSKLESAIEITKMVVMDIDQSGWAMKNLVELMKLTLVRESVIKESDI